MSGARALNLQAPPSPALLDALSGGLMVFSGAGLSAQAGWPTFRSQGQALAAPLTAQMWRSNPEGLWAQQARRLQGRRESEAHDLLHRLLLAAPLAAIATQNVDDLHEAAQARAQTGGQPWDIPIWKLHGSLGWRCDACGSNGPLSSEPPHRPEGCDHCGRPVRPGPVLFGEQLPPAMEHAYDWVEINSTRLSALIIGTSLEVRPANSLPQIIARAGGHVICVDPEYPAALGLRPYAPERTHWLQADAVTGLSTLLRWREASPPA